MYCCVLLGLPSMAKKTNKWMILLGTTFVICMQSYVNEIFKLPCLIQCILITDCWRAPNKKKLAEEQRLHDLAPPYLSDECQPLMSRSAMYGVNRGPRVQNSARSQVVCCCWSLVRICFCWERNICYQLRCVVWNG